ncbi:MAG: hypothetical protein RLZZ436_4231 [Planctomycetota bacterium]
MTDYYPTLIPAVSKIDWLSNIAFPNIDEASRQITSFGNSGAPGRLAWQASTSAPDGRTTLQWYKIQNDQKVAVDNPYYNAEGMTRVLEVSLPQLTEMLELGGYVPTNEVPTGIDPGYYNVVLWFQSPFDSWTSVYAYYNNNGSLVGGVSVRTIGTIDESVWFHDGVKKHMIDTSNIEIDYERRVLRLTFPPYTQSDWSNFQTNTLLNSNKPLAVGPMQAGSGVQKNLVATYNERKYYQPLDTFGTSDFAYFQQGYTLQQQETLAEYRRPWANQIGVVYQSRSFEPAIKQGFRAANPDLSLYSTLGGENWYLLSDPQSMVTRSVGWSNWKPGEPNNLNGTENNVVMTSDGTWYDLAADQQRSYVLVKPDGSYQLVEGNYTFSQAIADAGNRGGYLASVTDYDSQVLLKTAAGGKDVWINVLRAQYGVGWEAFNSATRSYDVYSNWYSGEPNDYDRNEDNAVMKRDGHWIDLAASSKKPYVLAKPDGSYHFISGSFTFSQAVADAGQRGGFVAGVADEFSQRSVQSAAGGNEVWINLSDTAKEGSWVGQAPTRNYISDSSATVQNGVFSQQNSSLINTTALNQININTPGFYEKRQMQNIAARQDDGLGLFFTRFEKNEGGDFQPVTQRVIGEYDRGQLNQGMQMRTSGATLNLQTSQLNLGTRVIIPPTENSRGSWLVNLEGMTISAPADVISNGGVGPYTIGQIPVWLVNKIGYTNAAGSQPPGESWTIPVTLKYPPSIDFPDGLTLNATAKTIHTVPTQPSPIPTTQLEIEFSATDAVTYRTSPPAVPNLVTRSVGWSNWKPGEPNNLNGTENNVVMTSDGTWYDLAADQQRSYVLAKTDGSYQYISGNFTYSQAIEDAANRGGYVAGVTDSHSQLQVKTEARGNDVWINVRRAEYGVGWEAFNSATRSYDHYSNWHSAEPNNFGGIEDNAVMASDGTWIDLAASQQRPYVLLKSNGSYQFINGSFTFSQAEADAGRRGGFVAGVTDELSQRSVQSAAGGREVWINLNDTADEGRWVTQAALPAVPSLVTGSVGWSNWKPGEPNNFNGIENNVVMNGDGTWNDMAADQQRSYVLAKTDGSYQYISGNFTYSQAIEDAANRGGYVAGVTDYHSQVQVKTEARGNDVWINVRRAEYGGGWQAFNIATRSYDHFSNWHSAEPNDFGGIEDNAVMASDGTWSDLAADQQRPYVLRKPDGSYQFISGNFTFSQAEVDAGQRGGFVAGVVDEFSQRNIQSAAGGREVWINLNDTADEGNWVTQAAVRSGTQTRSSREIASSLWAQLGSQRPDITVSDSTFSDAAVNSQQPLDTSQWVLWKPSFSNMQEAFSVLMSAYLKLYQNQLQLAGSVVDWYNGQIKALNECLEIVNSWGLSTNTKDSTTYTYVSTFADRTPGGGATDYGHSIAAQYDSIAQTLALYNIKLSDYVSVAWPDVNKTDQTSDPRKNNPDASKEPFKFTVYTDDQVPDVYTYKRYIWGGANTGSSMFDNFTTAIKNAISNLTNVSQQQTSAYSNLNSQYTQGVSTLTQVLEKLNQASSGVVAKL